MGALRDVADVPVETLERVAAGLSQATGFLDPPKLTARLRELLPEKSPVASIRRVVLHTKSEDVPDLLDRLTRIQENEPDEFPLNREHLEQLRVALPRLLRPIPALRRFRKAERLSKATGQPVEDIQLICDLRPVFDESREQVEGVLPFTRLKIVATGGDGLPNVFEAELTSRQVSDLVQQAEKAVKKLSLLRQQGEKWARYGVPELTITRSQGKDQETLNE